MYTRMYDLTSSVLNRWSVNRWQPDVFKKSAASLLSSTLYWRQSASAVLLLHQLVTSCLQFTSSFCQKRAKRSLFFVITFSASTPFHIFCWSMFPFKIKYGSFSSNVIIFLTYVHRFATPHPKYYAIFLTLE